MVIIAWDDTEYCIVEGVELSRVSTRQITGHFGDDLPSQSLD